jgi:hypothetical protein
VNEWKKESEFKMVAVDGLATASSRGAAMVSGDFAAGVAMVSEPGSKHNNDNFTFEDYEGVEFSDCFLEELVVVGKSDLGTVGENNDSSNIINDGQNSFHNSNPAGPGDDPPDPLGRLIHPSGNSNYTNNSVSVQAETLAIVDAALGGSSSSSVFSASGAGVLTDIGRLDTLTEELDDLRDVLEKDEVEVLETLLTNEKELVNLEKEVSLCCDNLLVEVADSLETYESALFGISDKIRKLQGDSTLMSLEVRNRKTR